MFRPSCVVTFCLLSLQGLSCWPPPSLPGLVSGPLLSSLVREHWPGPQTSNPCSDVCLLSFVQPTSLPKMTRCQARGGRHRMNSCAAAPATLMVTSDHGQTVVGPPTPALCVWRLFSVTSSVKWVSQLPFPPSAVLTLQRTFLKGEALPPAGSECSACGNQWHPPAAHSFTTLSPCFAATVVMTLFLHLWRFFAPSLCVSQTVIPGDCGPFLLPESPGMGAGFTTARVHTVAGRCQWPASQALSREDSPGGRAVLLGPFYRLGAEPRELEQVAQGCGAEILTRLSGPQMRRWPGLPERVSAGVSRGVGQ